MGNELLLVTIRRILTLTEFHVAGSLWALEESRLRLAESQRKIITSQQVIAKTDALIRTLRSELEWREEQEPKC